MRTLVTLALMALAPVARAHENQCYECGGAVLPPAEARVAALDATLARLDHASRMRRLQGEIAYSEAAIASLRRLQSEYGRVNRFGTGNALTLSAEQVRLELLREEMLLRDLRDQVLVEQRLRRYGRRADAVASAEMTQRLTVYAAVPPEEGKPAITIVNH